MLKIVPGDLLTWSVFLAVTKEWDIPASMQDLDVRTVLEGIYHQLGQFKLGDREDSYTEG